MEKPSHGLQSLPREESSYGDYLNNSGPSSGEARIVLRRASGRSVSLSTCSKVCAISFAVGVVIGFTLKRRLRRWVAKMLKRFQDD